MDINQLRQTLEAAGEKAVEDGLVMPESYEKLLDSDKVKWVD